MIKYVIQIDHHLPANHFIGVHHEGIIDLLIITDIQIIIMIIIESEDQIQGQGLD